MNMGEYCNVKLKKIQNFLIWLRNKSKDIEIKQGKKHVVIKYAFGQRPYPIPRSNPVNKHIVKGLMQKVTMEWRICTEEEFDERIK